MSQRLKGQRSCIAVNGTPSHSHSYRVLHHIMSTNTENKLIIITCQLFTLQFSFVPRTIDAQ